MTVFSDALGRLLRGVLRLGLALAAAVFVLSLIAASLIAVLGVSLWSLVTGRKPAPVVVFQRMREAQRRYAAGAFRPSSGASRAPGASADIVDVQATEVVDSGPRLGR
jgi:hypothetical protein